MATSLCACAVARRALWCGLLLCASVARAQLRDTTQGEAAAAAAQAGALAPYSAPASLAGYRGLLRIDTAYDDVRGSAVQSVLGEVVVLPARVSLFGGGQYGTPDVAQAPKLSALGGLRLQALAQARHGIDLSVAASYRSLGFSQLPAVLGELAVARSFGPLRLGGAATYGQSMREGDRFGSLALHGRVNIVHALYLGADSRYSMDLERDGDEPAFEPQYELLSSGLLGYLGPWLAVQLRGGLRMLQYRLQPQRRMGPELGVTLATAL
jgi:hypothetical protein